MLQGAVPVKVTVRVAVCPRQIAVVPLKTAVGLASTVTMALPLISPGMALQLPLTEVRVYVLVDVGDTANVYGLVLMLLMVIGVTPSVYVILQGATPVNVTLRLADWPLQMEVVPLKTAVGLASTVTVALPVRSAAIDAHLTSLAAVRV
jgi:hypothetical protein